MYAMRDVQTPSGRFTDVAPVGGGFGGVLWGSAGIVVPWETYLQYKDVGLLEQHYPAMAAYVDYLETTIDPKTGLSSDGQLGDWLGPQNNALGSAFLVTAYHAYDLDIMAKVAEILGKPADAAKYRELYEKRKAFFNATFVNAEQEDAGDRRRRGFGGRRGANAGQPRRPSSASPTRRPPTPSASAWVCSTATIGPPMVKNLADAVTRENKDDGGVVRPKYSLMTGFIGTVVDQQGALRQRPQRAGVPAAAQRPVPVVALRDRPGRDHDLGAPQRLHGRERVRRQQQHELVQPLLVRRGRAVDDGALARHRARRTGFPRRSSCSPSPIRPATMTWAEGHYDSMYGRIRSAWKVEGDVADLPGDGAREHHGDALPAGAVERCRERRRQRGARRRGRHLREARRRQGRLHAAIGRVSVHRRRMAANSVC